MTTVIMKSISKSKLKSQLIEFLRLVESEGEEIVVTDRGKPVVKISKYAQTPSTEELFGEMRGKVKYFEDLTTPTEEWTRSDLVEASKDCLD
ncbi:type II toxin-antitoxin system Phd/YefM family antitoxin [Nostoc sp.]|uniref:type II toxin-antitoxin system Phd/YefM family antitoxin n=1 Tax=Nostoc sp. TaxID=1180 RepID=UPI002FF774E0